jgi:hypothetical protein
VQHASRFAAVYNLPKVSPDVHFAKAGGVRFVCVLTKSTDEARFSEKSVFIVVATLETFTVTLLYVPCVDDDASVSRLPGSQ